MLLFQSVVLHRLDLVVLLCSSDEDPFEHLRRVVSRQFVDGLFISAMQRHDRRIDHLIERGIPFVALGRSLSGGAHYPGGIRHRIWPMKLVPGESDPPPPER